MKPRGALVCVVLTLATGLDACEAISGIQDRTVAAGGAAGSGGHAGTTGGAGGGGRVGTGSGGAVTIGSGGMAGGGTGGAPGSGGAPPPSCADAPAPLVTNFDDRGNGDGTFGQPGGVLQVRTFIFADGQLTSMAGVGLVHVTAGIFKLGGFGLRFVNGCVDASAYSGISFTLGGNPGPSGALSVHLGIVRDAVFPGSAAANMCPSENLAACFGPAATVPVPATPASVMLRWSDFAGGRPTPTTDGSDLLSIVWTFDLTQSPTLAYSVDITIDDLAFW